MTTSPFHSGPVSSSSSRLPGAWWVDSPITPTVGALSVNTTTAPPLKEPPHPIPEWVFSFSTVCAVAQLALLLLPPLRYVYKRRRLKLLHDSFRDERRSRVPGPSAHVPSSNVLSSAQDLSRASRVPPLAAAAATAGRWDASLPNLAAPAASLAFITSDPRCRSGVWDDRRQASSPLASAAALNSAVPPGATVASSTAAAAAPLSAAPELPGALITPVVEAAADGVALDDGVESRSDGAVSPSDAANDSGAGSNFLIQCQTPGASLHNFRYGADLDGDGQTQSGSSSSRSLMEDSSNVIIATPAASQRVSSDRKPDGVRSSNALSLRRTGSIEAAEPAKRSTSLVEKMMASRKLLRPESSSTASTDATRGNDAAVTSANSSREGNSRPPMGSTAVLDAATGPQWYRRVNRSSWAMITSYDSAMQRSIRRSHSIIRAAAEDDDHRQSVNAFLLDGHVPVYDGRDPPPDEDDDGENNDDDDDPVVVSMFASSPEWRFLNDPFELLIERHRITSTLNVLLLGSVLFMALYRVIRDVEYRVMSGPSTDTAGLPSGLTKLFAFLEVFRPMHGIFVCAYFVHLAFLVRQFNRDLATVSSNLYCHFRYLWLLITGSFFVCAVILMAFMLWFPSLREATGVTSVSNPIEGLETMMGSIVFLASIVTLFSGLATFLTLLKPSKLSRTCRGRVFARLLVVVVTVLHCVFVGLELTYVGGSNSPVERANRHRKLQGEFTHLKVLDDFAYVLEPIVYLIVYLATEVAWPVAPPALSTWEGMVLFRQGGHRYYFDEAKGGQLVTPGLGRMLSMWGRWLVTTFGWIHCGSVSDGAPYGVALVAIPMSVDVQYLLER